MKQRVVCRLVSLGSLVLLLAVGGCGPAKGTVTGKVSHKGKPVVWGSVTLIGSDNLPYATPVNSDGSYSIPNVPGGTVKIGVNSPNPDGTSRGGPAAARGGQGEATGGDTTRPLPPPGAWFALPEKYSDPLQSGLTGTVKGDSVINIELP